MSNVIRRKRPPENRYCSKCGAELWRECTTCGVTGEREYQGPRFHCGTLQTGEYCSECGKRLEPAVENCPFCNGRGWATTSHVCVSTTDFSPGASWIDNTALRDPVIGRPVIRLNEPIRERPRWWMSRAASLRPARSDSTRIVPAPGGWDTYRGWNQPTSAKWTTATRCEAIRYWATNSKSSPSRQSPAPATPRHPRRPRQAVAGAIRKTRPRRGRGHQRGGTGHGRRRQDHPGPETGPLAAERGRPPTAPSSSPAATSTCAAPWAPSWSGWTCSPTTRRWSSWPTSWDRWASTRRRLPRRLRPAPELAV